MDKQNFQAAVMQRLDAVHDEVVQASTALKRACYRLDSLEYFVDAEGETMDSLYNDAQVQEKMTAISSTMDGILREVERRD